jgi:hypothetical protein
VNKVITVRLSLPSVIAAALLALAVAAMVACTAAWFVVMHRVTQAPPKPSAEHTVPYNRHGQTVYLTRREDQLREWLSVAGLPLGFGVFALGLWTRYSWIKDQQRK